MSTPPPLIIDLEQVASLEAARVGGKALHLGRLHCAGFRIPAGFCLTVEAYEMFVAENALVPFLQVELGRKPLDEMRWEELWDAALRVRSVFLAAPVPTRVRNELRQALASLGPLLAVRSSAPGEDSGASSFAGLHESVTGVSGEAAVLDAVRVVWASLWSDAALLYRREMSLDPLSSRMAVVIQEMVLEDCSGVGFGCDPRDGSREVQVVEAVPGPCSLLVDGEVEPDRWMLRHADGAVLSWQAGQREGSESEAPLLEDADLHHLHGVLCRVEDLLQGPPDVEWTGRSHRLTLLQARPVTTSQPSSPDPHAAYLTLRPRGKRLLDLRAHVVEVLIPDLQAVGERFAAEDTAALDDNRLAACLQERMAALRHWREVYTQEFIPFAHGVRTLGVLYNDLVRPHDPYEFVGILRGQDLLALRRNRAFETLARHLLDREEVLALLQDHPGFAHAEPTAHGTAVSAGPGVDSQGDVGNGDAVTGRGPAGAEPCGGVGSGGEASSQRPASADPGVDPCGDVARGGPAQTPRPAGADPGVEAWAEMRANVAACPGGPAFVHEFEDAMARFMDTSFQGERLQDHPVQVLHSIVQLAVGMATTPARDETPRETVEILERRLRDATPPGRLAEVEEILETGRLSWRLRDDDNILLGRLESQLLRVIQEAEQRLRAAGRLQGRAAEEGDVALVADVLRSEAGLDLGPVRAAETVEAREPGARPRQLVGQPASQGIASGPCRVVGGLDDIGRFRVGEVLVCDAIQPMMTHLVPLAVAVVERRGGMLIHGAIIARELGIPCVNGVRDAARLLTSGTVVTVDGYLGIVTVGEAEFDLE